MEGKEKWQDLGCIEADAVPARGCGLRLRVVVEGDGAVVEPRKVKCLPPRSIPPTMKQVNFHHQLPYKRTKAGIADIKISEGFMEASSGDSKKQEQRRNMGRIPRKVGLAEFFTKFNRQTGRMKSETEPR
jgi:hypothetical protein